MNKLDRWYTGKLMFNNVISNNKPYEFPVITMLFEYRKYQHYADMDYFNLLTIIISNRIINADKKRSSEEIEYVRNFYEKFYTKKKADSAIFLLNQYQKLPLHRSAYNDLLDEVSWQLHQPIKLQLIYYMYELAGADGKIDNRELTELFKVGLTIGVSKKELNRISALYVSGYIPYPDKSAKGFNSTNNSDYKKYGSSQQQKRKTTKRRTSSRKSKRRVASGPTRLTISLQILGLNLNSSIAQIKAAYRRLAKENHPDRFINLGDFHVQKATEKMARINRAYEHIQRIKRFS